MQMGFSVAEGTALHGLIEETTGDIVIRLDIRGFLETASANIANIGHDLSQLLLKPHVSDLAEAPYTDALASYTAKVLEPGDDVNGLADWLEFPLRLTGSGEDCEVAHQPSWFAISLRPVTDDHGKPAGALGLLRSVERLRALEGEIYSRALIDPLTGLSNRHAFCAALRRQLASGQSGAMALFEVDRMRAIFMQYGQRTADEIIWGFAKFLEAMAYSDHDLAQFDAERFCVMLPGFSNHAAREWAEDVLSTFGSLALTSSVRAPRLSASAGLSTIECSVDWTLRQAELALVMARARGGMQVAQASRIPVSASRAALG
ncbi:MAG: GGDEF domain-containing protein [Erythrobacter sp.]